MPDRPNVLLMIADDHRHDAMGCAGDPVVRTLRLDRLAGEGVWFGRNQHMGSLSGAVCIPARAALMTGVNSFRASVSARVDDTPGIMELRRELPLLPEVFRRAGYRTHAVGKWHNDRRSFARASGGAERVFFGGMSDHDKVPLHDFDPAGQYADERRYTGKGFSTELFGEAATRFIRAQRTAEEPFFLYLSFTAPHDPRTPPPPYDAMYPEVPLPPNYLPEHPFDNGELSVRDELLAPHPRPPAEVRRHIAEYFGMISHMDEWVGRVVDEVPENTIVVYTADHGLAVGQHGLFGKQNVYDHSLRVPLIVRGPGLPVGLRVDALTHTPDLYPTLCDLAGIAVPESVEAQSLFGPHRSVVCSAYKDVMRAASDGRWKLIRYYRNDAGTAGVERVQLFEVGRDPHEMEDRVGHPAARPELERLAAALAGWQREVGDPWADRPVLPV